MNKFYKKYTKDEDGYNIGSSSTALATVLNTKIQSLTLSYYTLIKNLKHHPYLTEDEYLHLNTIIGKSHFIAQDGKKKLK